MPTKRQLEIARVVDQCGSYAKAAGALGMSKSGVQSAMARMRHEAPAKPINPSLAAAVSAADSHTKEENKKLKLQISRAEKLLDQIGQAKEPPKPPPARKGKAAKHLIRVVIPDSHGAHIDPAAMGALLSDLQLLGQVDEIVMLGDHLDCGGTFSNHQRNYTHEMTESYASDVAAANDFLDRIQELAPGARIDYLEGNHEQHVERWAARNFDAFDDARMVVDAIGPEGALCLAKRGIRYFKRSEMYDGLSVPGTIKRGKCFFVHGVSHAKHADAAHLQRFAANVVFGHVHRVMSIGERTVECDAFGAWCPGTLARLQPLYRHTAPTSWQHGYGVQFVHAGTGTFVHFNVPVYQGESFLKNVVDSLRR